MEPTNLATRASRSSARWALLAVPAALILTVALVATSSGASTPGSARAGEFSGVVAIGPTSAWAVGDFLLDANDIGDFKAATEHRTGGTWKSVGAPSPAGHTAALASVAAVTASNMWAVGQFNGTDGNDFTLIEHWNGSHWAVVPSPNPGIFGNALNGVSAAGAQSVWAVGYEDNPPSPLALRLSGGSWKRVAMPTPAGSHGAVLLAVGARAAADVWAVGYWVSDAGPRTLIEHWNGRAWSIVPGIDPSTSDDELSGVSAVAANDAWAVGYANTADGDRPLVEHWDGHAWSEVGSPNPGGQSALAAVSFDSSADGWAVGSKGVSTAQTLTMHWNGRGWSAVKSPNLSNSEDLLLGVVARTPGDAYAVGYHDNGTGHQTLVLHWNGAAWSAQ